MLSSTAYHAARTSGFMRLPSQRTLRDYVHFYDAKPGFQKEANDHLLKEADISSLSPAQRHVVLVVDEMKVREDIVFGKHSGNVVGLVYMGDFNNTLAGLESAMKREKVPVAGLVTSLNFPYAHFPTAGTVLSPKRFVSNPMSSNRSALCRSTLDHLGSCPSARNMWF